MFCVDKINYEHLAILSNLKSCQFAPKIVIFNLWDLGSMGNACYSKIKSSSTG